jgi:acetylornithine deacetylase/succinyl-diaminopimelate desuccinylase-like protein
MNARNLGSVWLVLCLATTAPAQGLQEKVRRHRVAHEQDLIAEYREFLAIPNVTSDKENIRRNAEFIAGMLRRRGVEAQVLEGRSPAVNPAVFGEVRVPGATRTVIFYAHYDGQPVNPRQWAEGWEPFNPKFVTNLVEHGGKIVEDWKPGDPVDPEWRLIGRGSADDKAGVMTIVNAYDALVKTGGRPSVNIKFFFEGEEELGSTNLAQLLELHRDRLASDLWVICDGPRHVSGRKLVLFGVRGDVNVELTVYGAKRPLHSGNYGNWAPNPAWELVNLLATMKDNAGHVLIKGFYDDVVPLTEKEKQALAAAPLVEPELMRELGLIEAETPGQSLLESLHQPSLNINGIQSANTGRLAANIIPTSARVTLDLRLVLGNDVERQIGRLLAHIKAQGFQVIDHEPTDEDRGRSAKLVKVEPAKGYNAQRTPMDLPLAQSVIAAVQSTDRQPVVLLPSAGGSLPLIVIEQKLGAKVITVPVVNYDNNQHAENENVKVRFLWEGIETMAAVMAMP